MIDDSKRMIREAQKEKIRRRMHIQVDPENYEYIPAEKQTDYYDNEAHQRVAIYARVSTGSKQQTTSFELQQRYYEDFVRRHPNWTLVKIYADEGISGTSLAHRDEFNQMIADCRAGKIDLIITKSVSRFARNIMITIGMVRELSEMKSPVGVFFESEAIFSLDDDSQLALSFVATMAEEESHTRSRSMETSLRMRLDNGIPLTPKLLGYTHDEEGNLIINPAEAPTVKLTFYMYLFGYSTKQIAEALIALGRKSYLGNIKWTPGGIVQILRNERHCGDVFTRKTFTPNYRDHKSRKNTGQRPRSRYKNHHEAIVSREDFIAVQKMLDNAKYKNRTFMPELKVINEGVLQGFVVIYPRWAAFKEDDFMKASSGGYSEVDNPLLHDKSEINVTVSAGDFDLRGFEVARTELFDNYNKPYINFFDKSMRLSAMCTNKFAEKNNIELLVNPITRKFAVRTTDSSNRQSVVCSKKSNKKYQPRTIPITAFYDTLYSLFGWNTDFNYRITGTLFESGNDKVYIFDTANSEAFLKPYLIPSTADDGKDSYITYKPLTPYGKRIKAIPEEWTTNFGKQYYVHEKSYAELNAQTEMDWKLRMEGQFIDTGKKINITSFEELRAYIKQELGEINLQEETNYESI
ncbi:MAG: recombinase family protein [Firmicutes bacterium]|jgi:site-specific DNA recombinase|nr:recombinase family protein [Bacillota bacterium]